MVVLVALRGKTSVGVNGRCTVPDIADGLNLWFSTELWINNGQCVRISWLYRWCRGIRESVTFSGGVVSEWYAIVNSWRVVMG